ncbi:MAG: hypothetical protein LW862_02495 [Rubrivivax sp.]|jgi:hypothetical protein|nr:hypothetical protein [Rubrivivax sp.]
MGTLSTLKLTAVQRPQQLSAVQLRRNKLLRRLDEQMKLASAQEEGKQFAPLRLRTVTDPATGSRRTVESSKRVKAWWFKQESGKFALSIRYGAKVLELAKGKYAVEVASPKDLISTLEIVKSAVEAGELDGAIEHAAGRLRQGFKK